MCVVLRNTTHVRVLMQITGSVYKKLCLYQITNCTTWRMYTHMIGLAICNTVFTVQ